MQQAYGIERTTGLPTGRLGAVDVSVSATGRDGRRHCEARLRTLAAERPRFGYRRLQVLLRREGCAVNHKRVYRLYREEGLGVRRQAPQADRAAAERRCCWRPPTRLNERWSMDFMARQRWPMDGRSGPSTSSMTSPAKCLAIGVDTSLPGARVVRVLDAVAGAAGLPEMLVIGQRSGVRGPGPRRVGLPARREAALHPSPGKPVRERVHRELQRQVPRRVPERALVRQPAATPGR